MGGPVSLGSDKLIFNILYAVLQILLFSETLRNSAFLDFKAPLKFNIFLIIYKPF